MINKVFEYLKKPDLYATSTSKFWDDEHISKSMLEAHHIYENNIRLDQYVVIDKNENVDVIRNWEHHFTEKEIRDEVSRAGFEKVGTYSDVTGQPYDEQSKTICIVVEK